MTRVTSGEGIGKIGYIQEKKIKSYIRGEKKEGKLHTGREKGRQITYGERKKKASYIRGEKKEGKLHTVREREKASYIR